MLGSCVVAVGLLAAGVGPVQQQPAGPPWANKLFVPDILKEPDRTAPPVIIHNFGPVPRGTLCKKTFTLTNIYEPPLQVIDVNPGCACLTAYPPQRILQPEESAEFTVTMDTRALPPGPASRELRVTVGGQEHRSTAVFRFEVDARPDVILNPGELALGTVVTGERKVASALLAYQGRHADWRVTGVRTDGPFDVQLIPSGAGKYRLSAELRSNAPAGRLAGNVSLTTTDPALPVVQVAVTGVVLAPVTVSADVVTFPKPVKVGEKDEWAIIVRSGNRPFRVRPVPDAGDGVSVSTDGWAGPTQRVVVRFAPPKPGTVRKNVRLETDLPGRPAVVILVEAIGE